MNVMFYDIGLLIIFVIFLGIFLYRKRKNVKKEGLLLLYRTKLGMKLIDKVGKKYKKTLTVLSYISIGLGYCLMAGILYLFGKIIWIYLFNSSIVQAIKVPPIMPLIPYLPQIFKLSYLPPFYFIYWIVIIAVIAITHEFAHGIFMRRYNVKVKSTGFGFFPFFLPVFLAAFVEQDEKSMKKSSTFKQMAILSAGTFANVLTAIFFFAVMWLFFSFAFTPSGVVFDTYMYSMVGIASISSVNGIALTDSSYDSLLELVNEEGLSEIQTSEGTFLTTKTFLGSQENNEEYVFLYGDYPAINAGVEGIITEVDDIKIDSKDKLREELLKHSPGDSIVLSTLTDEGEKEYEIVLGQSPDDGTVPWLGLGFINPQSSGVMGTLVSALNFKQPHVYYEAKFGVSEFIYNLLWWLALISLSVALVNMLPVGIFDGGRFFYLTILALTKKEKLAKKVFSFITYLFLFSIVLLMVFWGLSFVK